MRFQIAKGRKTGGKNFPKGNNANPCGRPATPPDLKAAQNMTVIDLKRIILKFMYLPKNQIEKVIKDQNTPAIELLIASIMGRGIGKGDHKRAEWILSRFIPPIKQHHEITGADGKPLFNSLADLMASLESDDKPTGT